MSARMFVQIQGRNDTVARSLRGLPYVCANYGNMKGEKIMKKALAAVFFCIIVFGACAFAQGDAVTVNIDGKKLEAPIEAQIVNGRTLLPMRAVFEAFGARVTWEAEDRIIFAVKGDTFITLKIGVPQMSVQSAKSEGNNVVTLDTAPFIDRDYTLVPVRAVAEALNARVEWIEETRTVEITK